MAYPWLARGRWVVSTASDHEFVRPGQVAPDRPARDACMQCGQPEAAHHAQPLTVDAVESAYRDRLLTAGRDRYEELTDRDLSARTVAVLRERGEFDPANAGHQLLAAKAPLSAAEYLELMAIGEALARYYQHPSTVHDAARAGAGWEQIGAARGISAAQARAEYREWATGQHALHTDTGRWGLDAGQYAAAMARAGDPDARCVVTFDLTDDRDTDFVLTEALREFAARQRADAEDEEAGSLAAQDRIRWAEAAETALARVENPAPAESEAMRQARAYLDLVSQKTADSRCGSPATCAEFGREHEDAAGGDER